MRPFLLVFSLLLVFWNSQVYSKVLRYDYPDVPDLSHMSEYDKASYWLDDRGEVDIEIYPSSTLDLIPLIQSGADISVVHVEGGKVIANASKAGFEKFLEYGFDYAVQTPVMLTGPVPMGDFSDYLAGKGPADWYSYPTYGELVGFQEKWAQDFPEICKMYNLGPAGMDNLNHNVYAMRISDNVAVNESEARYLETNTIHGDEVLNMMNCLHMVDTMLNSYSSSPRFKRMVDSLECWFIPNMNPDGTYPRGDNTVQYAQRRNPKDNFDLNRNNPYPCEQGNHKLYGLYSYYSNETKCLMKLHGWYKFQFAQDQHGGTETYLWPYGGIISRCTDEPWYKWLCNKLVDQIHEDCNNSGYMTSCGGDGVGHIYTELYECHGIRCDMNDWVGNGKSVTLESSVRKLLDESDLARHWRYCKEALLMSYELLIDNGLHGEVTDLATGDPLFGVQISRDGSDRPNGTVLTDSAGRYVKYMKKGTFDLTFELDGYQSHVEESFNFADYEDKYYLFVQLSDGSGINGNSSVAVKNIKVEPFRKGVRIRTDKLGKNALIGIYNISGKLVSMLPASSSSIVWDGRNGNGKAVSNGCYIVKIKSGNQKLSKSFILNR
ncbi:M14 family zinc carboxypeptidase [Fibrobacterota bacterium]